jgi:hypothetical protein
MTTGNYLWRELEQTSGLVLEPKYETLKYENGDICPVVPDLEVGAAEYVTEIFNEVGEATEIGDDAIDIPIVDVSSTEDRYKIFRVGAALSMTHHQERADVKGRKNIMARKQSAVSKAIAQKHNMIGAYGVAKLGVTGFLNNPSVTIDNSSFNFFTASEKLIVSFFIDTMRAVYLASNSVEEINMVVLPPEIVYLLIGKEMPNTSDTLMGYLRKALSEAGMTLEFKKDSRSSRSALTAGGVPGNANKHRITFCAKAPEVVNRHIEMTKLLPPDWMEVRNGRKIFPYASYSTPVIVNYPGAMRYVDVPIS